MRSQFLIAAEELFKRYRRPMSATELVDVARAEGLLSDKLAGQTPSQTMKSKLSQEIRRNPITSRFVRTRPGRFYLRALLEDPYQAYEVPSGRETNPRELRLPLDDVRRSFPGTLASVYEAPPLRLQRPTERVLVIPSSWLDEVGRFQGIPKRWKRRYRQLLHAPIEVLDRLEAEASDAHKQLLTYILVTRGSAVLEYTRGNLTHADASLRGSRCIGFGGHVAADDRSLFGRDPLGLDENVGRELSEELKLPHEDRHRLSRGEGLEILGLLNDDSSPLGRRHLAVVFRYEVSSVPGWSHPEGNERSVNRVRWITPSADALSLWQFEYWSQLCLREYFPELVGTQAAYRIKRSRPLRPPHILCVVGEIGSGKTEATRVLRNELGYLEINTGELIGKLTKQPRVTERSRRGFQAKAWAFITQADGPKRLAQAILDEALALHHPKILVDGLRQMRTLEELQRVAMLAKLRMGILYVHTPPDLAFHFYQERAAVRITLDQFLQIREAPVEAEVSHMMSQADAILYNWTGRIRYRQVIKEMFSGLNS